MIMSIMIFVVHQGCARKIGFHLYDVPPPFE
jgi:hypothetical protein